MRPLPVILIVAAVLGLGLVAFYATRRPTVAAGLREMGQDVQRGTRDAYDSTKDAAEDTKDAAKDAVK